MSLGYPYSYGDELNPEMAKSNLVIMFLCLLLPNPVQAAPILGQVEGFVNQPVVCPRYGIGKGGRCKYGFI